MSLAPFDGRPVGSGLLHHTGSKFADKKIVDNFYARL